MTDEKKYILYAEDDPDDFFFFKTSLAKISTTYQLIHVSNGLEAVDYLGSIRDGNPVPAIIVMDYNMPLMDGFRAAKLIRSMEEYRTIPLIIYTTNKIENDLEKYQALNIEIFWKGISLEELRNQIIDILSFSRQ